MVKMSVMLEKGISSALYCIYPSVTDSRPTKVAETSETLNGGQRDPHEPPHMYGGPLAHGHDQRQNRPRRQGDGQSFPFAHGVAEHGEPQRLNEDRQGSPDRIQDANVVDLSISPWASQSVSF